MLREKAKSWHHDKQSFISKTVLLLRKGEVGLSGLRVLSIVTVMIHVMVTCVLVKAQGQKRDGWHQEKFDPRRLAGTFPTFLLMWSFDMSVIKYFLFECDRRT